MERREKQLQIQVTKVSQNNTECLINTQVGELYVIDFKHFPFVGVPIERTPNGPKSCYSLVEMLIIFKGFTPN